MVDIDAEEDFLPSFASVNRDTMQNTQYTVQKVALVMHNAKQLENNCTVDFQNSEFLSHKLNLNLIDSFSGQVVCKGMSIKHII